MELDRNITSIHQRFLAFVACLLDTMQLVGITFILYLLKLSAGNGFWRKQNYFENKMCHSYC